MSLVLVSQPLVINAKTYKVYIPGLIVQGDTTPPVDGSGLILSTDNFTFSDTLVGQEVSLQIQVTNLGQPTPLNITTGVDTFAATHNCGTSLGTNQSCIVNVRFVPNAGISYSGTLSVTPLTGIKKTASLSGSGLGAALTATPNPVNFGSVEMSKYADQTFTITNTGNREAILATPQITNTAFSVSANNCAATLAPGQFCSVTLRFTPNTAGDNADNMKLVANTGAGNTVTTVPLRGKGLNSLVQIQNSLSFNDVEVGTTVSKPVSITNKGNTVVSINAVGGLSTPYAASGCTGELQPGAVCNLPVSFTPSAIGSFNGSLQIIEDSNIHEVVISGNGVKKAIASAAPSSLVFGDTDVGQASDPQLVVLKNIGAGPLTVQGFTIGTSYIASTTCAETINPQESCDYLVAFRPVKNGLQPSVLTIKSTLGDTVVTLNGKGIGGNTDLELSSNSIDFDATEVSTISAAKSIVIANPTANAVVIKSVTTTGPYIATSSCENAIQSLQNCAVSIKFTPGTTGPLAGSLVVETGTGSLTVSLSGTGVGPVLVVSPTQLDWGTVSGLSEIPAKIITLKSTGGLPVSVGNILISTTKFTSTTNCPTVLNDAEICSIAVTPLSAFEGLSTATLSVDSTSLKPVKPVELSAANNTYVAQAQAPGINFGNLPLSTAQNNAAIQDIVIKNTGVANMTLTGIAPAVVGMSLVANNCTDIAPQGSCVMSIGVDRSHPIDIDKVVKTTGQGVNTEFAIKASVQGVEVSWGRTLLDMGYVPNGTTAQAGVQLVNGGNVSADLRAVTLDGSGFSLDTSSCASVGPLQSCGVIVTFAPVLSSNYTSNVTSVGNNANIIAKNTLTLKGTSLSTKLEASTNSLDVGNVALGSQSQIKTVRIQNIGDNPVSGFTATVGPGFIATTNCPETIDQGMYCDVSVRFDATNATEGALKSSLTITSKAPALAVALSGYVTQALVAQVSASPSSLSTLSMNFGKVSIGAVQQKSVYVAAQGTTGQLVSSMTITGANASEFVVTAANKINPTSFTRTSCTSSMNAQTVVDCTADAFTGGNYLTTSSAIEFVIEARPTGASGAREALLTVQYTGNKIETFPITLTAPSLAKAEVNSSSLTFDPTDVGTFSQQTVRLLNTGTETLILTSPPTLRGSSTYTFAPSGGTTCQSQLAPGEHCDTTVFFTPVDQSIALGELSFATNDATSPTVVSLSGQGLRGFGELKAKAPSTADFGPVAIGSSQTQVFTFTNKGNKSVSDVYARLSGAPASVTLVEGQNTCGTVGFKSSVTAGENCTVTVKYTPTRQGETLTNVYLQVLSTAVNSPVQIAMSGASQGTVSIGVTNTTGTPITSYDFGTVSNLSPASYIVRATNTGTAPIYFDSVPGVSGDAAYSSSTTCTTTLAVNSSCDVTVTFNPTTGNTVAGQVQFPSNAGSSPNTVAFTGKGAIASATATAFTTYDFGTVLTGGSAVRSLTFRNTGTVPLSGITLSSNDSNLTQSGNNCVGSIAVNGTCTISITYAPTVAGTIAPNAISIKATAVSANDLTVTPSSSFTGSAVVASLNYTNTGGTTITTYNAGSVNNGSTSATTTIKLVNNTSVAVSPTFNTPGGGFNVDRTACATIAANSSCNISLSFTPTGPGTNSTNLTATVGNYSKLLTLTGTGVVAYNTLGSSLSMTIGNGGLRATGPTSANLAYASGSIGLVKGSSGYYFEAANNSATSRSVSIGLIANTTALKTYVVPKDGNVYGFAIDMNSSSFTVYNVTAGCTVVASSTFNTGWNNVSVGVIAGYTGNIATVDFNFGQSALSCVPNGYKRGVY